MTSTILVVDDEKNIRRALGLILGEPEFRLLEAASAEAAFPILDETPVDLVLLDLNLPGLDGLAALRQIRATTPEAMVVLISGQASVTAALEATREGAFDFLEKPLSRERVLVAVRNALEFATIGREMRDLKADEADRHRMIGASAPMARLNEEIRRAAPTTARILILGESGTGKELVARAVHEQSPRRGRPFVRVNCAAIPDELIESELFGAVKGAYTGSTANRDGKFLLADGGTLFLDEVADMSLRAQAKVLRALQEGEIERVGGAQPIQVDVRVVAATNKDLRAEVAAGRFREDLLFRLSVVPLHVPPLRERGTDVDALATHFLERYRRDYPRAPREFSPAARAALRGGHWPGNVRELQNVIERLAIMTATPAIDVEDLRRAGVFEAGAGVGPGGGAVGADPPAASADAPEGPTGLTPGEIQRLGGLAAARHRFEAACIRACLKETRGNVSDAARLLNINRTNLHKKLQSLSIEFDPRREEE